MRVAVLGSGSWGTALAKVLAENKHETTLWGIEPEVIESINMHQENERYLPEAKLPSALEATLDLSQAIQGVELIVLAVPSQAIREVCQTLKEELQQQGIAPIIVHVAKGIERGTELRLSQVIEEVMPRDTYRGIAVLSGPSHAEEVSKRMITTVACASTDEEVAKFVQDAFMTEYFRVYIHKDVLGVEVAGAIKNVIAIGAGVLTGLDQGDNAKAALITRGLFEMSKLGKSLGCNPLTFMGLAGMGDLIVTANSIHSRNFRAGLLIGKGVPINKLQEEIGETVEGVNTAKAVHLLSEKMGVNMPICKVIYEVLYEGKGIDIAIHELMNRPRKHEFMEMMEI